MPRPNQPVEKSKDFFGSMKRLIKNLKPWRILICVSLFLAMLSAILSLIAPNKLSDFTDIITDGIKPNTVKLEEVSKQVFSNTTMDSIYIDDKEITKEDQIKYMEVVSKEDFNVNDFDNLPESIYSLVKPKINMDKVKFYAILLGSLYLISAIFGFLQNIFMTTVSNKFSKVLRSKVSSKINKLPLKYFDSHETGDILSRITNDIDMVGHNLNESLESIVTNGTLFIGSIIMMFITNWVMAITAILASLIGFGFMFIILGKSQKYFLSRQVELGNLNGYIEEMYSGHNVVKAYNGEEEAKKEFDELNKKLFVSNKKSKFLSGLMHPVMDFVGNLGYVAVCVVGALLVMNNQISFGVIVAFTIYVRLFTSPLSQIAQAMSGLQSTAASAERVFEFLDEKEMKDESHFTKELDPKKVKGEIEFNHVKFGYDKDKTIINDFSVKVKPGQKVAIVGPTGAGKTTMVNLLMKFYEINNGDILIDGVSTKELKRENIHDLFCMVLQDTWLYEGTILDNIKFSNSDATIDEVWDACKVVGVDHFIKTLPGGINSYIVDTDSISAGEKQLLTIARGMLKNAPFLILDEATSNVDTRTEELVQKAMDKLTEGKTSFIIAHRLSTIKNADVILVMKDGNIIETGNHESLIEKNGFYAELYNSQFEL